MKMKMCERKTSIVVNGRRYKTIKSACKAYHTPYSIYNLRLSRGWDRIDAIVTPVQQGKQCVDHLGNHYDSVTHMCEAYGIDRNTFYRKKRKNIPIEKNLNAVSSEITKMFFSCLKSKNCCDSRRRNKICGLT